jgi:hypothetical protein
LIAAERKMTIAYEQQLNRDRRWALREGSMHFDKGSAVHKTLERIGQKLDALGVSYAVVGGMAMFFHGYRRFTEDVDILISSADLQKVHEELDGRGYLPLFAGSKNLRDTETGVRIEFLVSGEFPGDGKPKPVAFPNPGPDEVKLDGIRFLSLPKIVELKLASGMTNAGRLKDLADVEELIVALKLPLDTKEDLHPFVQDKFVELWNAVQNRDSE